MVRHMAHTYDGACPGCDGQNDDGALVLFDILTDDGVVDTLGYCDPCGELVGMGYRDDAVAYRMHGASEWINIRCAGA